MLFTFGLSIQGNHQLLTDVYSKEKKQKAMVDRLQSSGIPMASLHKPVTLIEDACKSYSWPWEVAIITDQLYNALSCSSLWNIEVKHDTQSNKEFIKFV